MLRTLVFQMLNLFTICFLRNRCNCMVLVFGALAKKIVTAEIRTCSILIANGPKDTAFAPSAGATTP